LFGDDLTGKGHMTRTVGAPRAFSLCSYRKVSILKNSLGRPFQKLAQSLRLAREYRTPKPMRCPWGCISESILTAAVGVDGYRP
jgi:hypothetical protein